MAIQFIFDLTTNRIQVHLLPVTLWWMRLCLCLQGVGRVLAMMFGYFSTKNKDERAGTKTILFAR